MNDTIDKEALRERVQASIAQARPHTQRIEEIEPSIKESQQRVIDTDMKELDIFAVYSDIEGYVVSGEYGSTVLRRSLINQGEDVVIRWINTKKENFFLKKVRGYKVCEDKRIQTLSMTPDSVHRINELVLCEIPRALFNKRKKDERERGDARRESATVEFKEEARRQGVKTFEDRSKPGA